MVIVVLMAGAGRRFADAADRNPDYRLPKPFIPVLGRPILEWTTRSLPFIAHYGDAGSSTSPSISPEKIYFAIRPVDTDEFSIGDRLRSMYGEAVNVVTFEALTRGNLETGLIVCERIDSGEPVLFLDSDNAYNGGDVLDAIRRIQTSPAAMICHFTPVDDDPKWCFAMVDSRGMVKELREKDPEALASGGQPMVGTFFFDSVGTFVSAARAIIGSGAMTGAEKAREFYMSQAVQLLVGRGDEVHGHHVDDVIPLGTPEDVEAFVGSTTKFGHNSRSNQ